jgi:hypothetical protein
MPGLTVTEKQHWRDAISRRIEKRVEAIRARHPALFDRMKRQAHARALESLGLAAPYAELESIHAEEAALARRKKQAQRTMLAALRGVPFDEVSDDFSVRYGSELSLPQEAVEALDKRQAAHQEQILTDDPIGREIANLEGEKENMLNTVWLACSPSQIRILWTKVGVLLGDEPTPLEREALQIEPAQDV